jgi:predicted nuclease of predicted toxin-antitoxin system
MAIAALEQAKEFLSNPLVLSLTAKHAYMRILLDECVNQRMRSHLPGHECQWARYAGFGGLKNGELLDAAEAAGFDVLVAVDRGFRYEQNLAGRKIAVVIFRTKSIALKDLLPHAPEALVALQSMNPGRVVHVGR